VELVKPVELAQPAPSAALDKGPGCKYSACRIELTSVAGFTDDLREQTPPIVGFHVTGDCPRCDHRTRAIFPAETVVMGQSGLGISSSRLTSNVMQRLSRLSRKSVIRRPVSVYGPEDVKVAVLTCQCTAEHTGSKAAFGCGASWLIGATFNLDDKERRAANLYLVSPDREVAVWPTAEAYETSVSVPLKAVQSAAKTWQTGLTAILGLVTVVSLVGGRSTLQALSGIMQFWIVLLAGIAVAANAWGIYKSTLASIGFPAISRVKDVLDLTNSDLWPMRQAIHATNNLRAAVCWSAFSFAAAIVAVGIVWIAHPAAAPAVKVDLTVLQPTPSATPTATVATPVCGTLPTPQPTGTPAGIAIVPSTTASPAPTVTYPMTSVAGIAPGTC